MGRWRMPSGSRSEVEDAVWSVFESGVATKALFSVPVLWPLARIKEEVTSPMYATVPIG